MPQRTASRLARQVGRQQQHFRQAPGLPFSRQLDAATVEQALRDEHVSFRQRLFSPFVTLWVFLSQILDADHSCRQAVARFLAYRAAQGLPPCSSGTAAYCRARQRLPEGVLQRLTRTTAQRLQDQTPVAWTWRGRPVKIVDGTTLSMPDTPDNQQAYPQPSSQQAGVGFPLLRLVVLFSLSVGTVLDAALGRYQGKQTGETALFRSLHDRLDSGDILLADRYFCSYLEIALLGERGVDLITRLHQSRHVDFRTGRRLGRGDHVVSWHKPARPEWLDEATYARLPPTLAIREIRVCLNRPGYRVRRLVVATTLLDPQEMPWGDVAALYGSRWQAELDLRDLKQTLQMDILRCQTPAMVRKEVWGHLLVYNLIRDVMMQAALEYGLLALQISFKGTLQTVAAFAPLVWTATSERVAELACQLRRAVARHRVGDRPGRVEPRARKRRSKSYPLLKEARSRARSRLLKTRCA
jgi:hypothetical protein